jgi:hypothetical protein
MKMPRSSEGLSRGISIRNIDLAGYDIPPSIFLIVDDRSKEKHGHASVRLSMCAGQSTNDQYMHIGVLDLSGLNGFPGFNSSAYITSRSGRAPSTHCIMSAAKEAEIEVM